MNEPVRLKEPTTPLVVGDEDMKRNEYLMQVAAESYIILIRKPDLLRSLGAFQRQLYGPVENSFSLGVEPDRTFLYWSSEHLDAWTWANRDFERGKKEHPDWEYTIYKAMDENLPVVINWDVWLDAQLPSTKTMSGVKNKYDARNLRFTLKGEPADKQKVSPAMSCVITTYSLGSGKGII